MSQVWRVSHHQYSTPLVLKSVRAQSSSVLHNELKILASLNHPSILRLLDYGTYQDGEDGYLYLITEHVSSMSIAKMLQGRGWSFFHHVVSDLLEAIGYVHARHIIHRDVSLQNILWDYRNHRVKIADFGISMVDAETTGSLNYGTKGFTAPEFNQRDQLGPWTDCIPLERWLKVCYPS